MMVVVSSESSCGIAIGRGNFIPEPSSFTLVGLVGMGAIAYLIRSARPRFRGRIQQVKAQVK